MYLCPMDQTETSPMNPQEKTRQVQQWAARLGLQGCGVSVAAPLPAEGMRLQRWLQRGWQAGMDYMARHTDRRTDITALVPGAESVISVCCNCQPHLEQLPDRPVIASYAFGEDYHRVMKDKLFTLKKWMEDAWGPVNGRVFTDSAPVFEKMWAARSGLGFIGRHTLLIAPGCGSRLFLGELVCDVELAPTPPADPAVLERGAWCGSCRKCIEACPAGALSDEGLDARRCLSYLTIEHRGSLDVPLHRHLFGCECCQNACPHNRQVPFTSEPRFEGRPEAVNMTKEAWASLTPEAFARLWGHTPLKRAGLDQLKRNLQAGFPADTAR